MLLEHSIQKLIAQIFDEQPDSVVWFLPVFKAGYEDGTPVDFEISYANHAATEILQPKHIQVTGTYLLGANIIDKDSARLVFQQCLEVWKSGKTQEFAYHNSGLDRYLKVQRSKLDNGVLSIIRNHTQELTAQVEKQQQTEIYQQILDTSIDGIMFLQAVYTHETIVDFRVTHCNKKGMEQSCFPANALGRTLLELLPHLKGSNQFQLHVDVMNSGIPARFETTFRNEKGLEYGWFIVTLTKLGDGVISNFVDVSERRIAEQEIIRQKDLLKNIFDASLSAIYTCEAVYNNAGDLVDFEFIEVNKKFRDISQPQGGEVIGKRLLESYPSTGTQETFNKLAFVLKTGEAVQFEIHYKTDTADSWYETSAVKMGVDGVVVTFADITEQKKIIDKIEQQRDLLDKMLQFSPSSISIVHAIRNELGEVVDFKNILVNDLAASFTGLTKEELLTKSNLEIEPAFANSSAYKMLCHTLRTGESTYTDYHLQTTGKWIEGAVSRMDEDHLICITTDVTATKMAELQMQQLLEALKKSNKNLEEFTNSASHDLKEPIRKVQFFTERLKTKLDAKLSVEEKGLFTRVELATERMQQLVDDLLDYSHVNSGKQEKEQVDLNTVLKLVLSDLEVVITEKKAKIKQGKLPTIIGYKKQLNQLFHNLVSNALKYHKPGEAPLVEIFTLNATDSFDGWEQNKNLPPTDYHCVEIKDNGIGFAQQYAERIFQVFTRLHGNSEYTGTGVGLAIVKKVVENHNGTIQVDSQPSVGASFRIYLPTTQQQTKL